LDTCFANPGTSEMQLLAEIGLTKGVRPILCLHENVVTRTVVLRLRRINLPPMRIRAKYVFDGL
jgi:hypothetical protein